jgi:hypothetical protein
MTPQKRHIDERKRKHKNKPTPPSPTTMILCNGVVFFFGILLQGYASKVNVLSPLTKMSSNTSPFTTKEVTSPVQDEERAPTKFSEGPLCVLLDVKKHILRLSHRKSLNLSLFFHLISFSDFIF